MQTFTFVPSQTGLMTRADSERLLRAVFPNYPNLQPCAPAPVLVPMTAPAPAPWVTAPADRARA